MQESSGKEADFGHAYIVGGGIAGLAAAVYLIRDGGIPGRRVHLLEQSDRIGGSLDGAGDPESGYVIRGGRMFEAHFGCTFDLLSTIPSLTDAAVSVAEELRSFTRQIVTSSNCRLVAGRERREAPPLELSRRDRWDLAKLSLIPESAIGTRSIEEYFAATFFETNFWTMWSTMFAFQRWHSLIEFRRYMRRFMHLMPGFNRLEGIHRTPLNQYDSIVRPIVRWLESRGVDLQINVAVTDVDFADDENGAAAVIGIVTSRNGETRRIDVAADDVVMITLGSMTEDSSLGTMQTAPQWQANPDRGAWGLWRSIARRSPHFGNPDVFCGKVEKSRWESFTVTLHDRAFFEFMELFSGNPAGTGGLVTFVDSNWMMSVVLAYQPHFANQPDDVRVFWGYGLHPERSGNVIDKPMAECSGREILAELLHHLPVADDDQRLFATANCIPCAMPFITSQFMPRAPGDRPSVVPPGARNFAFLGQFCELPRDAVFTVEYSVRTAQTAVYGLVAQKKKVTPIYRGDRNPIVVLRALRALTR